ncbi:MAG: hypothetical protein QNJ88_14910 [Acidimicrobiia bacterium]|nr:hypothetical protein [Acidimicrobiia bacterium]
MGRGYTCRRHRGADAVGGRPQLAEVEHRARTPFALGLWDAAAVFRVRRWGQAPSLEEGG